MKCYNCGATLVNNEVCTICGSDVTMFKKAVAISNICYNDGLSKANVRDLSGAIVSLNKSLRFNKENTDARNLLGLVYFEIGEVVDALSEWVISKNFQPENNIADKYLGAIQNNSARLETINQTIKKYNQALLYCQQNSEDLAVIQLKKVLSLNPNLIKGYHLLALLNMKQENYEKAAKTLKKALKINKTDTITLRYMSELEEMGASTAKTGQKKPEVKHEKDRLSYKSGNETIIQPTVYKENTGFSTVINIIIGVLLGACVVWFLVVPGIKQSSQSSTNDALKEANETIADKNTQISSLESELENAKSESESLQSTLDENNGTSSAYESLFNAINMKDKGNFEGASNALGEIKPDSLSVDAKAYYDSLKTEVDTKALESYYNSAYSDYNKGKYADAVEKFEKVVSINESYKDGYALYYLGQSCRQSGNKARAKEAYERAMEMYPNSQVYYNCQKYLPKVSE